MRDVLETVNEHLAAFNAQDLDRVMSLFADDAVFAAGDQLVIGRRGIATLFGDAFAQPIRATLQLLRVVVHGDTAGCELLEHLSLPGGSQVEIPVAAFYTVRGGLLARVRVYRDPPA